MDVNGKGEEKAKSNSPAKGGRVRSGRARMDALTPEQRTDLASKAAIARWNKFKVAASMSNKDNSLQPISKVKMADPNQGVLDLGIEKQIEIDGVGMGVLSDGTPFLTGRGLARLCGVMHFSIQGIAAEWNDDPPKARVAQIKLLLSQRGIIADQPYMAIKQRSGTFFAYPDSVCLAVLEYYAFDAGANVKESAKKNYRLLAGKALREFIYTQVGYFPHAPVPDAWRQFHDRVSLTYNSVPAGYFGVFKEMSDMIVTLGQSGLFIDEKFVPDISVGISWGKYWCANDMDSKYGPRKKYEHEYPDYFPQAQSNPQDCWCYPEASLGEFRRWMRDEYIREGRFAKYLNQKVRHNELPASFAQLAIAAYTGDGDGPTPSATALPPPSSQ